VIAGAGAGGRGQFGTPSGRAALASTGPAPSGATTEGKWLMPAGITSSDSMFSVRETPWHGLGAVLECPPATIAEAIHASGLGWRVEREPIAVDRGQVATVNDWWEPRCEEIPGHFATVRRDTRTVLGIVGERYRIVQNEEAFQFVDQLLGSELRFETAGSLRGGRRVWALATLPDHVHVGGDTVRPYVLLMNSHDGSTAVTAATTPVRVVCQNTLNWALERALQRFSIRHTEQISRRVHEARRVLELSIDYYEQFTATGNLLASQRCAERQLQRVLDELYPSGTEDRISDRTRRGRERTKRQIVELYLHGETQGNAPGSKWAALNTIVEYGDWHRPMRQRGDRFARAIDDGADKTRALKLIPAA
jgi:phage/plasmid-like protein (TIGR03299 family)